MSPAAALLLDADLRIRAMTAEAARALGLAPDAVGRRLADVLPAGAPLVAEARATLDGGAPREGPSGHALAPCALDDGPGVLVTPAAGRDPRREAAEFRALVEASSQIVWRVGPDGAVTEDSPSWRAFTGQAREEWLGSAWADVTHPDDVAAVAAAWEAAFADRSVLDVTFRLHHAPTGSWRWIRGRAVPLEAPDGTFYGFLGMTADVHDARLAEDALRASERRFRALVEASAQVVWQTDAEGRAVDLSPTWRAATGQTRDEWAGDGWVGAVHPDDRGPLLEAWRRALRDAEGFEATFRLRHAPTESWRWTTVRGVPLFGPDGAYEGHVGMNVDVTEQRAAAEALAASEARFRNMAETVPDILFTADPGGEITYVNAQFAAATGVDTSGFGSLADWFALVHPDDRAGTEAAWRAAVAAGTDVQIVFRLRAADGGWRWVTTRARPVLGADGAVEAWYGAAIDIDERVRMERALQDGNETLEARVAERTATVRRLAAALTEAEQAERRRIAEVLHDDLQQHLYAGAMFLSAAREAPPAEAAPLLADVAAVIREAMALTRTLVTDLSPAVLDADDVAEMARWLADEFGARHGLAVGVEAEGACRVPAMAVRALAYQALRELLFNVVKHGGVAEATVRLTCADGALALAVEDAGAGFAMGTQEDGFGLTALRDRLTLAGGRLDLASAPGAGTRAEVVIPVCRS